MAADTVVATGGLTFAGKNLTTSHSSSWTSGSAEEEDAKDDERRLDSSLREGPRLESKEASLLFGSDDEFDVDGDGECDAIDVENQRLQASLADPDAFRCLWETLDSNFDAGEGMASRREGEERRGERMRNKILMAENKCRISTLLIFQ